MEKWSIRWSLILLGVGAGAGWYVMHGQYEGIQKQVAQLAQQLNQERFKQIARDKLFQERKESKPSQVEQLCPPLQKRQGQFTWRDVQEKVDNTVVQVVSEIAYFNWLEPYKTPAQREFGGSGFFINPEGYMVTNYHVIDQVRSLHVRIPSLGKQLFEAEVVGASPERDVALIKLTSKAFTEVKEKLGGTIPYLELGNSDEVVRAQQVMALGYPLGQPNLKSTIGNVSGRERLGNTYHIQITAPLNPGNSGGPSVDYSGKVIGVNTAGIRLAQNIGYIIPINEVKSALKDLYKVKLLRKPLLGCIFTTATKEMVQYFGNPPEGGWYIARVFKNTILEKVGVRAGDMLYAVNGYKVDMFGEISVSWSDEKVSLLDLFNRLVVGDQVKMVIYRTGERKDITFKLEPRYLLPIRKMYPDFEHVDYEVIGGLTLMELRLNHISSLLEKAPQQGAVLARFARPENRYESLLVVTHIFPDSPAKQARVLYSGALVEEINGQRVATLDEFRKAIVNRKNKDFVTIKLQDEHRFAVLAVKDILEKEDQLVAHYFYKKSPLIDALQ